MDKKSLRTELKKIRKNVNSEDFSLNITKLLEYKNAKTGVDPGFYREADAGAYLQAYKKAESAVAKDNEAVAKEAVPALLDALNTIKNAETIPVTAGLYMLVSSSLIEALG